MENVFGDVHKLCSIFSQNEMHQFLQNATHFMDDAYLAAVLSPKNLNFVLKMA
jgi:hypothetical protein